MNTKDKVIKHYDNLVASLAITEMCIAGVNPELPHFYRLQKTKTASDYKKDVYKTMRDFEHRKKVLIVKQYNQKYKKLKDSLDYFDEFRKQNPKYST